MSWRWIRVVPCFLMACSNDTAAGTGPSGSSFGGGAGTSGATSAVVGSGGANAAPGGAPAGGGTTAAGGGAGASGAGASGAAGNGGSLDAGRTRDAASSVETRDSGVQVTPCLDVPPRDPGGTAAQGSACCGGLGACVAASSLGPGESATYGYDTCSKVNGLRCAPAAMDARGTRFTPCVTHLGDRDGGTTALEGRCVPACFAKGNPQVKYFARGNCASGDLCVPCFSPVDATETGVCSIQPGDHPDTSQYERPTPFRRCGIYDGGMPSGLCAPASFAPTPLIPGVSYPSEDCAPGETCSPDVRIREPDVCLPACVIERIAQPGICVPTYVLRDYDPTVAAALPRETCPAGYSCTVCEEGSNCH